MAYFGYQVPLSAFIDGAVIPETLKQQLIAAGVTNPLASVEVEGDKVDLWFMNSNIDPPVINNVITNHRASLEQAKQMKYAVIDAKTDEIIARGFTFNGKVFSTSLDAQARILGMDSLRADPAMTYPIIFNTIDDDDSISIPDADTVHAFTLTGIGYYRAAIDSGSILKAAVRAGTSIDEVQAVTDTRT